MSAVRQITYNSPISKGESPMSIRNQIYGVAPSAHSPLVLTKKPTGAIADVTPVPHNGCRPPKRRRV